MKKVVSLIFFSSLCLLVGAEELKITLEDSELGIPLEGVTLTLAGTEASSESDADGVALLELPEGFSRGTVSARLPGYAERKFTVTAGQTDVAVKMSISEIIEGKELVVERSTPGKSDEKTGVSVVMESAEMETTANMGLIEDIMSSISTLPGVGFTGGWQSQPSIRGGYPSEMGTVLDGVYVLSPWHWGGAYSIFNPGMVATAKMSNGIFSARYGRAMSGLLEVTTVEPDPTQVRFDAGITSISSDFFAQVPVAKKAGILIGGKVTYMETLAWLNDGLNLTGQKLSETIPTMPFIRDFYAKGHYTPIPELDISLNGFFGSDGIGIKSDDDNDGIRTVSDFDWLNLQGFASTGVKWMASENSVVNFSLGYSNNTMDLSMEYDISGTWKYSDAFLAEYDGSLLDADETDGTINGSTGYTIASMGSEGFSRQTIQQFQGTVSSDILVGGSSMISFGADEVLQIAKSKQEFTGSQVVNGEPISEYRDVTYTMNLDGNRVLNSSAFALWSFGGERSPLTGEIGLRGEHFFLWNDNFELNTLPVASPRLSASWAPISDFGPIDRLTFSAGAGLFSMFPSDAIAAEKKYGIKSFEVSPDRALFNVLGAEAKFVNDWSFRLEGYYKYYFNRLYITAEYDALADAIDYGANTDGEGYATGFDLMLQKKNGRALDGYLSYSFVVAKYRNPKEPAEEGGTDLSGNPLGIWYYPSFHRFHTLNLVLNWRPTSGFVVTTSASVATGTPRTKPGAIEMSPVLYDGSVIERYRRSEEYDDSLRTDISCPVDVRISYSNYYRNSKVRWEYYIGAEDVFVNLYSPSGNTSFDEFTGKEIDNSDQADFNIGIPMFSVGYKVSY